MNTMIVLASFLFQKFKFEYVGHFQCSSAFVLQCFQNALNELISKRITRYFLFLPLTSDFKCTQTPLKNQNFDKKKQMLNLKSDPQVFEKFGQWAIMLSIPFADALGGLEYHHKTQSKLINIINERMKDSPGIAC